MIFDYPAIGLSITFFIAVFTSGALCTYCATKLTYKMIEMGCK